MAERTVFQSCRTGMSSVWAAGQRGGGLRHDAGQLRQCAGGGYSGNLLGIVTERDLMTRVLAKAPEPGNHDPGRCHDPQSLLWHRKPWCPMRCWS